MAQARKEFTFTFRAVKSLKKSVRWNFWWNLPFDSSFFSSIINDLWFDKHSVGANRLNSYYLSSVDNIKVSWLFSADCAFLILCKKCIGRSLVKNVLRTVYEFLILVRWTQHCEQCVNFSYLSDEHSTANSVWISHTCQVKTTLRTVSELFILVGWTQHCEQCLNFSYFSDEHNTAKSVWISHTCQVNTTNKRQRKWIDVENNVLSSAHGSLSRVRLVSATNDYGSPNSVEWESVFGSPVSGVAANGQVAVVTCDDATLHVLDLDRGQCKWPAFVLRSPASRLALNSKSQLMVVTACGHLTIWDLENRKVMLRSESMVPIIHNDSGKLVNCLIFYKLLKLRKKTKT